MKQLASKARVLAFALAAVLAGCGGYVDDASPPTTYSIGGTITGLGSNGLVLADGTDSTSPATGAQGFTFANMVASGSSYAVTVLTQPANATCSVSQGAGTVGAAAVTTVQVNCVANAYRVGGTISGLVSGGLVLANGADTVAPLAGASSFTFANAVTEGGSYAAAVKTQPSGTICSVGNGSGTIGAADVTNVQVTCSPNAYSVGGTITGLTAAGLVLANGADTVSPSANATSYVFPAKVAFDGTYSVTVQQQPAGQSCGVTGTFPAMMGAGDVNNVLVTCSASTAFTLLAGNQDCSIGGGTSDGTGAGASLPSASMASDAAGNVYVLDDGEDTVRKVTPSGVVTTIAGQVNQSNNLDGTGTAALFYQPQGIAVDSAGNLYVAESNDIRKITAATVVTTLAGGGFANGGFADGTGAAARFLMPYGIALDAAGNAYVVDTNNNVLRKVTQGGVVTTLAGGGSPGGTQAGFADGAGTSAMFRNPWGVAVDAAGNVFVADRSNNAIRKITPGGVVTTLAGAASGFADGTGAAASFIHPGNLAIDSAGNLYVIDQDFQALRIVSPSGVVTTLGTVKNFFESGVSALPPASVQFPINLQGGIAISPSGAPYVGLGCAVERIGP